MRHQGMRGTAEQLLDSLAEMIPAFIGEVRDAMRGVESRDPARLQRLLGS